MIPLFVKVAGYMDEMEDILKKEDKADEAVNKLKKTLALSKSMYEKALSLFHLGDGEILEPL